ncbi:MAG: HEPN domain-containing protein [Lachnospiraceae bacterium]|nr:HEPN domain-containing protein [Lachnospiraceae bacterium]
MNETLLRKAVYNYNVATMIYNSMGDDEAYLNYIGYHLQQAVELAMKYMLEKSPVEPPKTHDIDQLIRVANENGVNLQTTDYIREHSEMFSMWEAKTRYVLDYRLEMSKIDAAMDGVGEYLDQIEKTENGQNSDMDQPLGAHRPDENMDGSNSKS